MDLQLIELLNDDFSLDLSNDMISEDELLYLIEQRVKHYLDNEKELMLSYLYRLDIPMAQISAVLKLTNVIPPEKSLALLIYKRQLERLASKKKYKQSPLDDEWKF